MSSGTNPEEPQAHSDKVVGRYSNPRAHDAVMSGFGAPALGRRGIPTIADRARCALVASAVHLTAGIADDVRSSWNFTTAVPM
jgi:hypothetical protein